MGPWAAPPGFAGSVTPSPAPPWSPRTRTLTPCQHGPLCLDRHCSCPLSLRFIMAALCLLVWSLMRLHCESSLSCVQFLSAWAQVLSLTCPLPCPREPAAEGRGRITRTEEHGLPGCEDPVVYEPNANKTFPKKGGNTSFPTCPHWAWASFPGSVPPVSHLLCGGVAASPGGGLGLEAGGARDRPRCALTLRLSAVWPAGGGGGPGPLGPDGPVSARDARVPVASKG